MRMHIGSGWPCISEAPSGAQSLLSKRRSSLETGTAVCIILCFLAVSMIHNIRRTVHYNTAAEEKRDLYAFIRNTWREVFSILKFVPTNNRLVYEWSQRRKANERLREDIASMDTLAKQYKIDYLLSKGVHRYKTLVPVFQDTHYVLYKIRTRTSEANP